MAGPTTSRPCWSRTPHNFRRFVAGLLLIVLLAAPARAQRRDRQTARDLFYAEAGLIVAPEQKGKGRFSAARKSAIAVTLGLKYRVWKLAEGKTVDVDPGGPFQQGDQVRLGIEINDTGYLYIVHRRPSGTWRRLFPTPDIEHGNHFVHSGVTYPIPPIEGLTLAFPSGADRVFVVLSRAPVKELESLVRPLQPEGTVSALPEPEIPDGLVESFRTAVPPKDLVSERVPVERAIYVVNRTGKPDSQIIAEIRFEPR
jgi:hypothetical protein